MVMKIVFSLISVPCDANASYGNRGNRGHQNGASRNKNAVIGALGMVGKKASNYVLQIPGALSLAEIQETTLMGTPHIL